MKTYARIEDVAVAELFETDGDITKMFHPSITWVDVSTITPEPQVGWSYADGVFSAPPGPTLTDVQATQIKTMTTAYLAAIAQSVIYETAAGVSQTFQADAQSISNLHDMLAAYPTTTPTGFYWIAQDNTKVPFVRADLEGLAATIGNQGWTAFQNLQTKKAAIRAATTRAQAQAVVW